LAAAVFAGAEALVGAFFEVVVLVVVFFAVAI
jgi:hypothetical protein